jgi:NADH-quinone oxidoreductase subunit L
MFAIAVFAPLVGSLIALLLGRHIGDRAVQIVTIACMILASVCGVSAFIDLVYNGVPAGVMSLGTWIEAGTFHVEWALRDDPLAAVMVAMVTCVATLIHIYSVGYMAHDNTIWKFFSYLNLFTFAMLMLVTADNLLQLFFGWEGVGLASYLLIGYYYDRPAACAAAMKAFIVNRIGDLSFVLGIALIFIVFGSVGFEEIFAGVSKHTGDVYHLFGHDFAALEVIGVLLFIGAMGKSAQLGLHVWLPDAMEGPTPVSALIHAATMVTAGVFLMARMSPLMEFAPHALGFVTFIGASTALFAATIACVQNDIKRVIAYSTCSQLGYMFIAAGVGAYQASMFHLLTHAFFKALLFLSAGAVIHAMSDEQDIRKMGGIWKKIPITYVVMWIGSLALAGVYPFAGYYSKDAILEAAYASGSTIGMYGFWCGLISAGLTGFYSWRLLILTFHGAPRADQHTMDHVHESPAIMTVPLILLAVGAVVTGFMFRDQLIGENWEHFWGESIRLNPHNNVLIAMEHVSPWVSLAPSVIGIAGIALAYLLYVGMPYVPGQIAMAFPAVYRFLLNKWYFDELYNATLVQPTLRLARVLWQVGDAKIIDGMPNGIASLTGSSSGQVVKLQTGSIASYAFAMLIGVVALVSIYLVFLR